MTDRAFHIHFARVVLAEAAHRRHSHVNRDFYWILIGMAANARRTAQEMREVTQRELFA